MGLQIKGNGGFGLINRCARAFSRKCWRRRLTSPRSPEPGAGRPRPRVQAARATPLPWSPAQADGTDAGVGEWRTLLTSSVSPDTRHRSSSACGRLSAWLSHPHQCSGHRCCYSQLRGSPNRGRAWDQAGRAGLPSPPGGTAPAPLPGIRRHHSAGRKEPHTAAGSGARRWKD